MDMSTQLLNTLRHAITATNFHLVELFFYGDSILEVPIIFVKFSFAW